MTLADCAINLNIAACLDIESVFHIAFANNSAEEGNVSSLYVNAFPFHDRLNIYFVTDKQNLSVNLGNNCSAVRIHFYIFADWQLNIFPVLCLKIFSKQSLSGFAFFGKHFLGKRLSCTYILYKIKFLKVNLTVGSFFCTNF